MGLLSKSEIASSIFETNLDTSSKYALEYALERRQNLLVYMQLHHRVARPLIHSVNPNLSSNQVASLPQRRNLKLLKQGSRSVSLYTHFTGNQAAKGTKIAASRRNIGNVAKQKNAAPSTKLTSQQEQKRQEIIDLLISRLPKANLEKVPEDEDQSRELREFLLGVEFEDLKLVSKTQKNLFTEINKMRTDLPYFDEIRQKLKKNNSILRDTQMLSFEPTKLKDVEYFLCLCASRNIVFPSVLGCTMPYTLLEDIKIWFTKKKGENNVLKHLDKIKNKLMREHDFCEFKFKDKFKKNLTSDLENNILHNVEMLLAGARFFELLETSIGITSAKDHALIRSIAVVLLRNSIVRNVLGRRAQEADVDSAYFSINTTNMAKTAG